MTMGSSPKTQTSAEPGFLYFRRESPGLPLRSNTRPLPWFSQKKQKALQAHISSLQKQGKSKAQIVSEIRKLYPAKVLAEAL